ncbi:MAG: alpha/beta hydrolase [Cycloclasticus sp. symbiont of Bathymodiolus heckerae]|nr:MAG: alpha/beta hydrolase [Cycloclasticus sp. symbiont of Bathymodiolus heckerae]
MTVELNFTKYGDIHEPLLILHGLFGSARNWHGVAKQLAERYTVYTLDLRNHGSSPHADDMDYASMSADVSAFMARQNLTSATVIGHSMGGKVAMELALSDSSKVNKLVVVDIAPVVYKHNFDDVLVGLYHVPVDTVSSRKDADAYLAEKVKDVGLRQFLLQNLVTNTAGGYQWRVNLASIEENMPDIMGFSSKNDRAYSGRTQFIKGGKSTYLASRYKGTALNMFPNAEFKTIDQSGHWPHIESPQKFMATLDQFLAA